MNDEYFDKMFKLALKNIEITDLHNIGTSRVERINECASRLENRESAYYRPSVKKEDVPDSLRTLWDVYKVFYENGELKLFCFRKDSATRQRIKQAIDTVRLLGSRDFWKGSELNEEFRKHFKKKRQTINVKQHTSSYGKP